jgi:cyclase
LQQVGDVRWLFDKLKFSDISKYIDELVIVNASPNNFKDPISKSFKESVIKLMEKTFVPLTIGGGLTNLKQVQDCFKIGADKIILNSVIKKNQKFIKSCVNKFGSQAVLIGIDFKKEGNNFFSYLDNGKNKFIEVSKHLKIVNKLKCGEVFLVSMDQDGTGFGFEKRVIELYNLNIPLVLGGGAGNPEHFRQIIFEKKLSGLMTGNLFNFLGDGLNKLRKEMLKKSVNLRLI